MERISHSTTWINLNICCLTNALLSLDKIEFTDRLDLWTVESVGCICPDGKSTNCACCVKPGGCLCTSNLNKCAQCGLEDSCQRSKFSHDPFTNGYTCSVTLEGWIAQCCAKHESYTRKRRLPFPLLTC